MTDFLSRRLGVDRDHGAAVCWLCPCQELLIGPVPLSLPGRMGLKCPAYPPVPHRCLPPPPDPAARNTLRDGSGGRATAGATNSTASVRSGSGRICHCVHTISTVQRLAYPLITTGADSAGSVQINSRCWRGLSRRLGRSSSTHPARPR